MLLGGGVGSAPHGAAADPGAFDDAEGDGPDPGPAPASAPGGTAGAGGGALAGALPPPPPLGDERYDGELSAQGLRHGVGRFVWKNGSSYEGQVRAAWQQASQARGRSG